MYWYDSNTYTYVGILTPPPPLPKSLDMATIGVLGNIEVDTKSNSTCHSGKLWWFMGLFFFGRFNHYGSGSKKVPLQDVLSYALEFAQSKPGLSTSKDVDMQSPKSSNDMNADMGRQELRFVIVDLNETYKQLLRVQVNSTVSPPDLFLSAQLL